LVHDIACSTFGVLTGSTETSTGKEMSGKIGCDAGVGMGMESNAGSRSLPGTHPFVGGTNPENTGERILP